MNWIYFNGKMVREEEALVSVKDRGFLFGEGAFTTLRVSHGKPEFLQAHLERLMLHCQRLQLKPPCIKPEMIQTLIDHNQAINGIWRLKIVATAHHLIVFLDPSSVQPWQTCRVCYFPLPIQHPCSDLKTLAYLDRQCVLHYAQQKGYDDALVLSFEREWLETAFSNIFWTDGKKICLPDPALPYLKGIFLTQLIKQSGLPVEVFRGGLDSVPQSACVFLCNSMTHLRPVIEIEGRSFKRYSEIEKKLSQSFHTFI